MDHFRKDLKDRGDLAGDVYALAFVVVHLRAAGDPVTANGAILAAPVAVDRFGVVVQSLAKVRIASASSAGLNVRDGSESSPPGVVVNVSKAWMVRA
jgi:hypothetical protein